LSRKQERVLERFDSQSLVNEKLGLCSIINNRGDFRKDFEGYEDLFQVEKK
jgi:hypothetical protein